MIILNKKDIRKINRKLRDHCIGGQINGNISILVNNGGWSHVYISTEDVIRPIINHIDPKTI